MTGKTYPDRTAHRFITIASVAATMMTSLDTTIANVALPHVQGNVSATQEEISWVLTSYLVASAIFTPLTGWLARRIGRKALLQWSVSGFTVASILCGVATNLNELVLFRMLQGVFGAALIPMSQAILLDINPPERHGSAMAIWGMGSILGPILGPALGGWLTDNLSWRWVFYINIPVGVLSFFCFGAFLSETHKPERIRLDLLGFASLALALTALQLMLDRGQTKDWFDSREICIEGAGALFFAYIYIVHTLTTKTPFIDLKLFANRNFLVGSCLGFWLGFLLFSPLALLPQLLEGLMGRPVLLTGLITAPRGVGTFATLLIVGPALRVIDARIMMFVGFVLTGVSTWLMSGFSLQMDDSLVIVAGALSGVAMGLIFVPLAAASFATLPDHYRNDGAAMFTVIRNMGSAMGISIMQAVTIRNASITHSRLVETVRPDNPIMARAAPSFDFSMPSSVAHLNAEITRQAAMVSYVDSFWALCLCSLAVAPLVLLMRASRRSSDGPAVHLD